MHTSFTDSVPRADLELARRLERAEGRANAAYVEARAEIDPSLGAIWIDVAGAYAMFDGPQSPLTQTFGLGIFDPVGEKEFEELELFFEQRGAPVAHEVSPFISQGVLALLNERGYRPIEFSSVLIRPLSLNADRASSEISVRKVAHDEIELWSRVAGLGWSSESAELAAAIEELGRVIGGASGAHCFLASWDDRPIGAAALCLSDDIALLAGASTIPDFRRRGGQRALLESRLHFAAEHGARLAMMVAAPGSGSQRNAERQGFRIAYTRTKFLRSGGGT